MNSPHDRVLGVYPLSIATSLAIEGAVGVHPDRPANDKLLTDYREIWVNLRTLFRNYYNAITKEEYPRFKTDKHIEVFVQEINQFQEVVEQLSKGQTKVVIYYSEYTDLVRHFKKAVFRTDSTENQIKYTKSLKEVLAPIVKENPGIVTTRGLLPEIKERALMLTHFPVDLFVERSNGLSLLESHTGAIKHKHQWHTKFVNGKTMPQIPFRMDMLSIFGDNDMFKQNLFPYRKAILELSIKYKWSSVTTRDKIIYGIDSLTDKFLAANLREIITNR